MRTKIKTVTAAVAIMAAAVLAGCTGTPTPDPSSTATPTAQPGVVMSVPPKTPAGQGVDLVVEARGRTGPAKLYAFVVPFGQKTTCTDTSVTPIAVTLTEGRQVVRYTDEGVGDVWFVLTGEGWATPCGAPSSVMRSLDVTRVEVGAANNQGKVGQPFSYLVSTTTNPPAPLKAWDVKVSWLGPYATAPEAQSAGCDGQPVAMTATARVTQRRDTNNQTGGQTVRSTPTKPGVYRLVAEIAETSTTARVTTVCEAAPLVVIS